LAVDFCPKNNDCPPGSYAYDQNNEAYEGRSISGISVANKELGCQTLIREFPNMRSYVKN